MNTVFLVAPVIEALFGTGLVLVPGPIAGAPGVTPDAAPATFVRLFGSALVSLAVMPWLAIKSSSPELKKGRPSACWPTICGNPNQERRRSDGKVREHWAG